MLLIMFAELNVKATIHCRICFRAPELTHHAYNLDVDLTHHCFDLQNSDSFQKLQSYLADCISPKDSISQG